MAEQPFSFSKQWQARCFLCGASYERYRTDDRHCKQCQDRYRQHKFFRDVSDLASCFATIMPEAEGINERLLRRGFRDLFLGSSVGDSDLILRMLFGKGVFSHELSLPCGQPVLFEIKHLAQFAGFKSAWTLDLSPYIWSGTLKDLRSWAVLSLAIEHRIKHLALWTAGNAGYSLAKLVHRWNATVQDERMRKTVYCLVDAFAPPEMVVTLRSLQCRVAPISTGSGAILSREQLYHVVASLAGAPKNYWQVTDGWDGIGVFMYSLLARQCLHFLRNQLRAQRLASADIYIVLPLGTGNLLLGFVRGMERVGEGRAKIVAAVPYGDHMMIPFLPKEAEVNDRPRMRRVAPVAPKLTGFYSPLSPCLWHLTQDRDFGHLGAVEFIEVDRAAQIEAAARVLCPAETMTIAAEPSALIAFGAVKQLAQRIRDHGRNPGNSVVLVVNSGFGIMGVEEQEFYTKSIFAFR